MQSFWRERSSTEGTKSYKRYGKASKGREQVILQILAQCLLILISLLIITSRDTSGQGGLLVQTGTATLPGVVVVSQTQAD